MNELMTRYFDSIPYVRNLIEYKPQDGISKEEFMSVRVAQLQEIQKIKNDNDAFLSAYFEPLEKGQKLTADQKDELVEFAAYLSDKIKPADEGVLLRIYTILYHDSFSKTNLNEQIKYIYKRAHAEYTVKHMSPTYSQFRGYEEIRNYVDLYDSLNNEAKDYFMRCWCNQLLISGYDYRQRKEVLDFVLQKKDEEPDNLPYDRYLLACYRNIKDLINVFYLNDRAKIPNEPEAIELAGQAVDYINNHMNSMKNSPLANRLRSMLAYQTYRFHSNQITLPELLDEIEKLSIIEDDYNVYEQASCYFLMGKAYINYSTLYDSKYNSYDAFKSFRSKIEAANQFIENLKPEELNSAIAKEYWGYLEGIAVFLRYDQIRAYYDIALKAMDKDLYCHSNFVTKLSLLLFEHLNNSDSDYFRDANGESAKGLANKLYNMSMFHDIGLYRMLHLRNFYHRSLTEDEESVYHSHTKVRFNYDLISMMPPVINDAILYHHDNLLCNCDIPNRSILTVLQLADYLESKTNCLVPGKEAVSFEEAITAAQNRTDIFDSRLLAALSDPNLLQKMQHLLDVERPDFIYQCYNGII